MQKKDIVKILSNIDWNCSFCANATNIIIKKIKDSSKHETVITLSLVLLNGSWHIDH